MKRFIYASQYEEVQVQLLVYASQYEEVRRTWAPLVQFVRVRVVGIGQLGPPPAAVIGPASASLSSRPIGQELPMSSQKADGDKSPSRMTQSMAFVKVQPQLRKIP